MIINTTLGNAGDVGSTAATLLNKLEDRTLEVAKFNSAPLESLFAPYSITNAKTHQWNRQERIPVPETPTQLEEGVTPEAIGITINSITATLEQYGNREVISELAELTANSSVMRDATDRMGQNMGETRAQLLYNVANAATSTVRVADRATDDAIQVGDTLTYEEITQIMTALASDGVPTWPNGAYRLVVCAQMYGPLLNDPDWKASVNYGARDMFARGYVGTLANVDVVMSNSFVFRETTSTTTGNSSAIRSAFAAGSGWAGVTSLDSADRKLYIDPPGSGEDFARQRYNITWKMTFKSVLDRMLNAIVEFCGLAPQMQFAYNS